MLIYLSDKVQVENRSTGGVLVSLPVADDMVSVPLADAAFERFLRDLHDGYEAAKARRVAHAARFDQGTIAAIAEGLRDHARRNGGA